MASEKSAVRVSAKKVVKFIKNYEKYHKKMYLANGDLCARNFLFVGLLVFRRLGHL